MGGIQEALYAARIPFEVGMKEYLDKERIQVLLRKADDNWFIGRTGKHYPSYEEHLAHTADYIAKHYNGKGGSNGKRKLNAACRGNPQGKDSQLGQEPKKTARLC